MAEDMPAAKRARTGAGGEGDGAAGEAGWPSGSEASESSSGAGGASSGSSAAAAVGGSRNSGAIASSVVAPMAAGGSPFDALPDELLARVLFEAARRKGLLLPIGSVSTVDPKDDEPDVRPDLLVKLRLVCRRFRRVAEQPQLWERVILVGKLSDNAAVEALSKLPATTRAAIRRSIINRQLEATPLSYGTLVSFCRRFRDQLTTFALYSEADSSEPFPFAALPALIRMESLQHLCLRTAGAAMKQSIQELAGPLVQESLACLSKLSLVSLCMEGFPLTIATLEALAPLSGTLTALKVQVFCQGGDSVGPAIAACARFAQLERLGLEFIDSGSGDKELPFASELDAQPLSSLTKMRCLSIDCWFKWIGWLGAMPQLDHLELMIAQTEAADIAAFALPSLAASLRVLQLTEYSRIVDEVSRAIASALPRLANLECLDIIPTRATIEALAAQPLAQWAKLTRVELSVQLQGGGEQIVPTAFLERLASDVPSLKTLNLSSPLNFPRDMSGFWSLRRLPRLVLRRAAPENLNRQQRQALEAILMDTEIVYE